MTSNLPTLTKSCLKGLTGLCGATKYLTNWLSGLLDGSTLTTSNNLFLIVNC